MHVPAIENYLHANLIDHNNQSRRYERSLEIEPREGYVQMTYSDLKAGNLICQKRYEIVDFCDR